MIDRALTQGLFYCRKGSYTVWATVFSVAQTVKSVAQTVFSLSATVGFHLLLSAKLYDYTPNFPKDRSVAFGLSWTSPFVKKLLVSAKKTLMISGTSIFSDSRYTGRTSSLLVAVKGQNMPQNSKTAIRG